MGAVHAPKFSGLPQSLESMQAWSEVNVNQVLVKHPRSLSHSGGLLHAHPRNAYMHVYCVVPPENSPICGPLYCSG